MNKITKILLYTFGLLLLLLMASGYWGIQYFEDIWFKERPDHFVFESDMTPVHFEWSGQDYGDYFEPHDIIMIPVQIEGIHQKCYFQLDTGAPTSMIYGKPLASLLKLGLSLDKIYLDSVEYLSGIEMTLGGSRLKAKIHIITKKKPSI